MSNKIKQKGLTLIELVIVIAIISILLAILAPSIWGYINLSKKKATISNARIIYEACTLTLVTDDEATTSFRTPQSQWTVYEATPEGKTVSTTYKYNNKEYIIPRCEKNISKISDFKIRKGNYPITVIARVDGKSHPTGATGADPTHITRTFNTWDYSDARYKVFVDKMSAVVDRTPSVRGGKEFPVKMPYNDRADDGYLPLVRWLIVRRLDTDDVEIWAGDGYKAENGPIYRVYPDPNSNYF